MNTISQKSIDIAKRQFNKENPKNDFIYIACDNTDCKDYTTCKRYKMWIMGAENVTTNGGDATKHCKKYLPMKGK